MATSEANFDQLILMPWAQHIEHARFVYRRQNLVRAVITARHELGIGALSNFIFGPADPRIIGHYDPAQNVVFVNTDRFAAYSDEKYAQIEHDGFEVDLFSDTSTMAHFLRVKWQYAHQGRVSHREARDWGESFAIRWFRIQEAMRKALS